MKSYVFINILLMAILPLVVAAHTWVLVLLKVISKTKALNFFTWLMLLASTVLYFELFGDNAHKEYADVWLIFALSYMAVYGPEEWGVHDQNH